MKPSPQKAKDISLDPEDLRSAMRAWTAGVSIVCADHQGQRHGMTVNSFTSISLDPAWISISLQRTSRTHELILQSGAFGLSILAVGQVALADRFSGKMPHLTDRFTGLQTITYITGSPLIKGCLAHLDCRVRQSMPVGANTLFIAEVVAVHVEGQDEPLVYHNRSYWGISGPLPGDQVER